MKKQILISISFLIIATSSFSQTTKRALFIGNSYIGVNNLPTIVAALAQSAGDSLIFDSNSPGGQTFSGHSTNPTSINKIKTGNWDYVVLQEQSQLPSFPIGQVETSIFPYATFLDSLVKAHNPCGETMFYMTWGRKNGDAANCGSWPPVCTYSGMDSLLYLRYMMMAEDNNALVSPVGSVWKYLRQNFPSLELYQSDESHPSLAGSYAAACTFYATIFRKNPLLILNDYSLSAVDAANIRAAVKTIVFDDLSKWHIGEYDPVADFNFNSSNSVTFNNLSINATTYEWNFGDGQTSTAHHPVHTYSANGNYSVTLIAHFCDYSDTIIHEIEILGSAGINERSEIENSIQLSPNPFSKSTTITKTDHVFNNATVSIYNSYGQNVLLKTNVSGTSILLNREQLSNGFYFIQITEGNKMIALEKFLINN